MYFKVFLFLDCLPYKNSRTQPALQFTHSFVRLRRFKVWFGLLGFFGISTFVVYLTPNPFLLKLSVPFKTIQVSMCTQYNCQKHFYFNLFKQLYIIIQFSVSTVLLSKTVQFQIIQFSISTQLKCKYSLIVKNISISGYSV